MDFACNIGEPAFHPFGPWLKAADVPTSLSLGLTSRELAPYTKTVVGVDISQGAVDTFNEAASNQGLAPDEMRAVCAELKGVDGELDGLKFDVITVRHSPHLI